MKICKREPKKKQEKTDECVKEKEEKSGDETHEKEKKGRRKVCDLEEAGNGTRIETMTTRKNLE